MDKKTVIVKDIAFLKDIEITQDGEFIKKSNDLDTNLRALDTAIQNASSSQTDYSLTISAPQSPDAQYAAQYEFKQCGQTLATINIPKDMVVQEGSVVDITFQEEHLYDGQTDVTEKIKGAGGTATEADAGKYIKLVIANKSDSTLYIKATDLVDTYTVQQNAAEVQLAISGNNVISASIVNASIAKSKLDASVQASLGKADTALQASDVVSAYDAASTAPVNGVAVAAAVAAIPSVDISGKADKDTDAVEGNLAMFDANGNPVDSGKAASDFAEANHTHDSLTNGPADLDLSQAGIASVTAPGPEQTWFRFNITGGTATCRTFEQVGPDAVNPDAPGSQVMTIPSGTVDIPVKYLYSQRWYGYTKVGDLVYTVDCESKDWSWQYDHPDEDRNWYYLQIYSPADPVNPENTLPNYGIQIEIDGTGTADGVPSVHEPTGANELNAYDIYGRGSRFDKWNPTVQDNPNFTGSLDSISTFIAPGPNVTKVLATTVDVENAVTNAVNALDAEVTSSDGINVQVKVTQTDGVVTAVNVTTDNTYYKPEHGIPTADIADGAITASKLADLTGIILTDEATTGANVGKRYRISVLDGRVILTELEPPAPELPTYSQYAFVTRDEHTMYDENNNPMYEEGHQWDSNYELKCIDKCLVGFDSTGHPTILKQTSDCGKFSYTTTPPEDPESDWPYYDYDPSNVNFYTEERWDDDPTHVTRYGFKVTTENGGYAEYTWGDSNFPYINLELVSREDAEAYFNS